MKWLVRMRVPYDVAAKRQFYDGYDWHQALWQAFPDRDGEARDFLTRVDKSERDFVVYLLSAQKPVCPAWCPSVSWECKEIKETFLNFEYYRFDLLANPTRRVVTIRADGTCAKNSRREAFLKPDEQISWLLRKGERGGFRVVDAPPLELGKPQRLAFQNKRGTGSHVGVRFKGVLQVTNRQSFQETFKRGIGSAKGFGFGMLMLQPVSL